MKIIRKVIESENKSDSVIGKPSDAWETDDWAPYKESIVIAQDMLANMGLMNLLCRIIAFESKREIKEEAYRVGIAVLLGGN